MRLLETGVEERGDLLKQTLHGISLHEDGSGKPGPARFGRDVDVVGRRSSGATSRDVKRARAGRVIVSPRAPA